MEIGQPSDVERAVKRGEKLEVSEESPAEELYNAVLGLKRNLSWGSNVSIDNKEEELKRFIQAWDAGENYEPRFEFSGLEFELENCLEAIRSLNDGARNIDVQKREEYGFKALSVEEIRNLFRGVFQEIEQEVRLAANLESFNEWRSDCLSVWPMDESSARDSREFLRENEFEDEADDEELYAEDVAMLFRKELERLGIEYDVEVRNVAGCHNIPEDRTVVVAKGASEERVYRLREAEMLAKHEIFHVVRSYNGSEASGDFPPILGVHTPFYDETEEGGATLREQELGVMTGAKLKDYHLRNVAAYRVSQGTGFMEAARELASLGASRSRAFGLLTRNREVLRHHIYLNGMKDWKTNEKEKLMVGKVNPEWAEKVWREVEADGVFSRPEISPGKVFNP